ncbi:hypothetical protein ACFS5J_07485 [Flavobacterium chuncheonense]|uniref:Lipoprotein n=1 Tax=Flavobacterium chuncheonense TaxID=2026653 RepID=A0ABW5YL81_9FLAO
MRKLLAITLIITSFLLTSCSSGWNCKSSYVKADSKVEKTTKQQREV